MNEAVRQAVAVLRYCEETGARCGECPSGKDANGIPKCHSMAAIADLLEKQAEALDNLFAALEASYAVREDERKERRDLEEAFIDHARDQIKGHKGPYICCYCVHGGGPYSKCPGKDCPPDCDGVSHWEWGGLPV